MDSNQLPPGRARKRFDQFLGEGFQLYRKGFLPFVAIVAIGSLVSFALESIWNPPTGAESTGLLQLALLVAWSLATIIPVIIAQAAVTGSAWRLSHGEPPHILTDYLLALRLARYYLPASLFLVVILTSSPLALLGGLAAAGNPALLLGFPLGGLGLFLLTRWSLFVPVVIVEQRRALDGLRTSWSLVQGRTWRTLSMLFAIGAFILFVILTVESLGARVNTVAQVALRIAAPATTLPLASIFLLLLFAEYRSLDEGESASAAES